MRRVLIAACVALLIPVGLLAQAPARVCGAESVMRAGTFVPALLITEVNSDIPGDMVAQVSRDVFDYQMRCVVIPRGSRLIGRYDSQVAVGQNRLVVAWTLLQFPDGSAVELPGLAIADMAGRTGVSDKVDNHYRRVYGNALLLSLIGAGAGAAVPPPGPYSAPSPRQAAAQQAAIDLQQLTEEQLRRNLEIKPTVKIRAGNPFVVMVNRDMILPVHPFDRS